MLQAFQYSRIWNYDNIILILSHRILALFSENAYNFERYVANTDRLIDGGCVREKIVDYRLSEHAYFPGRFDVRIGKKVAVGNSP